MDDRPAAPGAASRPALHRLRIRYTKLGRTRFVSARDLGAVFERSLRRAALPIAYSEGFTPHPKVSFPDALPVGTASTGEYAELTFTAPPDLERDPARLSDALPEGMDVLTAVGVPEGTPKLARLLPAALWELAWPPVDAAELTPLLSRRAEALLAADHAEVTRHRPDGDRILDVRPALLALVASTRRVPDADDRTVLRAVLRNDGPTVRPSDLVTALARDEVAPPPTIVRVVQGEPLPDGVRDALGGEVEPLVIDVDAEAA